MQALYLQAHLLERQALRVLLLLLLHQVMQLEVRVVQVLLQQANVPFVPLYKGLLLSLRHRQIRHLLQQLVYLGDVRFECPLHLHHLRQAYLRQHRLLLNQLSNLTILVLLLQHVKALT